MAKQRQLIDKGALPQQSRICGEESSASTSVIFDPESLVLDPRPGIEYSLRRTMSDLSIAIPFGWFAQRWTLQTPFMETLITLLGTNDPQRISEATQRYCEHFNSSGRFKCTMRAGSLELLVRLSRNPHIELHYLTHIGSHSAFRLLDVHGLKPLVRSIITPDEPCCPGIRPSLMQQLVEQQGRSRESWCC